MARERIMMRIEADHIVHCLMLNFGFVPKFDSPLTTFLTRRVSQEGRLNWAIVHAVDNGKCTLQMGYNQVAQDGALYATRSERDSYAGNYETSFDLVRWLAIHEWLEDSRSLVEKALGHYMGSSNWDPYPFRAEDFREPPVLITLEDFAATFHF